jgi:diguanylate cyclase (GGDEF)-like protein
MRSPSQRGVRSRIGLRLTVQYALLAVLPIAALGTVLYLRAELTPAIDEALGAAAVLALIAALALGAMQAQVTRRRLAHLTESTRRIARQDFSAPVPVQGSDEVAVLGQAINEMARGLGESLAAQGILAQMDDAILTKLDVHALIRNALRCVRVVTHADTVVLGLFDAEAADTLRVFIVRRGERSSVGSKKLEMGPDRRLRLPASPMTQTDTNSPFPREYDALLREEGVAPNYLTLPIVRDNRTWGVLVSCHEQPTILTEEQHQLLDAVVTRLNAGFSGAERDRKLHSLAYLDPLTGLPNRIAMQSLLDKELANAKRAGAKAAVLFIDLDRFQQVNDTYGHAFGDRLLVHAANRIRNNVREEDIVARVGADEFTVILSDVQHPDEASAVARKLIHSLGHRFEIDGKTVYTGACVGIAIYPDDAMAGPELMKMADTAMNRAKGAGRNRYAFFVVPMDVESQRRSALEADLRSALERGEFVLHYQPQVDLRTGALCGVEALVRWQHPKRGLLYPRDFIGFAEEIGLIPELGEWVLNAACRQHERWRNDGVRVPRVSVNVSNGQLPRSNFLEIVRRIMDRTQMPPGALEIEVTESLLVEGGKTASDAINQLVADGVLIAIDDFGTGYSSFSYLKTMPAKVLKLDMSFLVGATTDNDAGKIVAAIVNMAHALQKEVVAEGVESVDQLKLLKILDCERGQGYLFGKAVPPEHIERMYRGPVVASANPAHAHSPEPSLLPAAPARRAQAPEPEPVAASSGSDDDWDSRGDPATVPLPLADYDEIVRRQFRR